MATKLTIDHAGRSVIPKIIRERMGLRAGTELDIVEQAEGVLIRRAHARPSMVTVDGMLIHQGLPEPGADWSRVLDEVREERLQEIWKA